MRKPLIGAVVGLTAFLAFGGVASADFTQTADITFTKPTAGASSGIKTSIKATETDPTVLQPKAASKVVVNFPKGTKFDGKAAKQCKASAGQIQATNGGACRGTQIGSGLAMANVKPLLNTDVGLTINAYNATNNHIIFYLVPQAAVGNPLVLTGTIKGNKLTTPVPRIEAVGGSGVFAVLTDFELVTKAARSGGSNFLTTPKTCPGTVDDDDQLHLHGWQHRLGVRHPALQEVSATRHTRY